MPRWKRPPDGPSGTNSPPTLTLFDDTGRPRIPDQHLRVWTPPELVTVLGAAGWDVPDDSQPLQAEPSVYMGVVAQP
jgi:hypothetical protein